MAHRITFIPGDGIGPEVAQAAKRCLDACEVDIRWEEALAGDEAAKKYGEVLPVETLNLIKKNKVALKGPVITPIAEGFRSVNVQMRQELNLYVCLRPCKWYQGVHAPYEDVDLVIFRENTEDLYAGIEYAQNQKDTQKLIETIKILSKKEIRPDSAVSIKPISESATKKVVKFACEYMLANKRKKLTCVHKANIMKFTDGLFLNVFRKVAGEYRDKIELEDRLIDNMCMQLIQKPQEYDGIVLPNLYGDIVSDLCAGLVGGLGVTPGANIGDEYAIFEPTHGSAPKYKGKNKVNPTAMILSGVLMLKHIGESSAAQRLEKAVAQVIKEAKCVTYDLKRNKTDLSAVGTSEMADAIIAKLKER